MSDAHTVVTRAWAGPTGVTWSLGMRNVPQERSPFLPLTECGGGERGYNAQEMMGRLQRSYRAVIFSSHLSNPPPTSV